MLIKDRFYRRFKTSKQLLAFQVMVKESDLYIYAEKKLEIEAREILYEQRGYIESFIQQRPDFETSLIPWNNSEPCALIIREMIKAGNLAGVGPMASIAGAIAQFVGEGLLKFSKDVIVENGGDLFIKTGSSSIKVGIFAGKSPLSNKIGLKINSNNNPISVCTSSGTVGHSLSMGCADAVTIISESCTLADATATATGNYVKKAEDIEPAIDFAKNIQGIKGVLIIKGKHMGAWGDIELIPISL